ncbi:Transmembrane gamma-carboxyglutamic acid protein like [Heracleum sosnowskyi]|uniref:Transmembrane gamma-carboxyglutamic acid protein like n=1 Tax=Heracleum sosnowskyi TaxID=360622 RepID=A0AAD8MEY0_9APIA|nr:Transmembrane gamma-carboxyglutamic acid protein like [Heracleum sosnowskyi]
MAKFQDEAVFSCELQIIRARNIEFESTGSLFVRCYMSAGNNKRVRFQSREVSSSNMAWNQSFSLSCFGTKESMTNMLLEGTVIFELRLRSEISFFGRTGKSQLMGKAEVPWKTVYESSTLDIEKWIVMNSKKSLVDGVKPPAVEIGMKVGGALPAMPKATKQNKSCGDKCECKSCVNCELFALDAALELF